MSDWNREVKHVDAGVDVLQRIAEKPALWKRCRLCRGRLGTYERKYHAGLCALAAKTAKQARRRATLRQRALGSRSGRTGTIG